MRESMEIYPRTAAERAMKLQEVLLRATSGKIKWWQAAELIGISERQMLLIAWFQQDKQRRIDSDLAVLGSQLQDLQVFLAALIPAKPLLKQVEGHTEPAGGEQLIAVPVVLEGARLAH